MKTLTKIGLILILFLAVTINLSAQEIFDAVRNGDLAKVKELVEKGADINVEKRGLTPIYFAMVVNNKGIVDYLLDQNAKLPNVGTPNSSMYLNSALKIGSLKYLEKCLQQGLNSLIETESKNTLLHYASESNSKELVIKLIELGVPVNKTNIYGWTPLHMAAYRGNKSVAELLILKGADMNVRSIDGCTPYNLGNESKKTDVVDYLIGLGADRSPQKFPKLIGEYFGQPKPGRKAIPFAPGIISPKVSLHSSITFSPDGKEAFWKTIFRNKIMTSKKVNNKWTVPDSIGSVSWGDVPFISPNGNKLYLMTIKQVDGKEKEVISVMDKTPNGWSEPHELPDVINSIPGIHWQFSVDRNENLYFSVSNNAQENRIYYSEYKSGKYSEPRIFENLKDVNASMPYISPDGSFLIITAREGFKILFKKKDGTWNNGRTITDIIGMVGMCPIVTHDGKYLFFWMTLDGNNIPYWVDASFIEDLRKEALKDDK